ncbi:ANK [Mytilus coruscus]|uniref:ANK n=1 Tax=Mytilus coruscus TaxID=42192 RepID=A0A6J8A976_MYTCO|nr:ANK [Mytilus coruscus]
MASTSCSSFMSTASTFTNYARLGLATQNELSNLLRELLLKKKSTHISAVDLNKNSYLSNNLNAQEWIIIQNVRRNKYNEFDVPLMYKIIRNLNLVPMPTQGWGNPPVATDIAIGDDIERIRQIRNAIVHRGNTKVTDHELTMYFSVFKDIASRFESYLMKTNREFVSKIEDAETCCIDKDTEQTYLKQLNKLAEKEIQSAMNVGEVSSKVDCLRFEVTSDILKLDNDVKKIRREQQEAIPENIREQFEKDLEKWKQDDIKFVPTKASKLVFSRLNKENCVTIVGCPGVGKTATARHVALKMKGRGYTVIPIAFPIDIRTFYKPGQLSVFVIDDVCGKFAANQQLIYSWEQLLGVIEQILSDNCKIVVSCRSHVYKDRKFSVLYPFISCECNLVSTDLRLTRKQENININEFFSLPFNVLEKQLISVWDQGEEGRYTICALALCVIRDNRLEGKYLESKEPGLRDVLDDVCEACGLSRGASTVKILENMDTLVDTYFKEANGIYTAVHDKVFDFLAKYCGKMSMKMLDCLIEHASSGVIRERFIWNNLPEENDRDQDDFIIVIPDSNLTLYLNRLVIEWSHGNIKDVFLENNNMKNENFREKLLTHLRQLDTAKQNALACMQVGYAELRFSCLEMCCAKGYTDFLSWILEQGVDINQCVGGTTPFTFACKENNTEVITEILQLKVDINKTGSSGMTPLHAACLNFLNLKNIDIDLDVLDLLLKHGACTDKQMLDGSTPLIIASISQNREAVKRLLNSFANCNIALYDSQRIKEGMNKMGICAAKDEEVTIDFHELLDAIGRATPLHLMCLVNDIDIIRLLLRKKADINIRKEDGSTPLFLACQVGFTNVVRLLLNHGADKNIRTKNRKRPLDIARQNNHSKIVSLLEGPKRKSTRIANRMKRGENPNSNN